MSVSILPIAIPALYAGMKGATRPSVCVVEESSHMMVIESANPGHLRYHILHGVINPIEGIGPDEIRIKELATGLSVKA